MKMRKSYLIVLIGLILIFVFAEELANSHIVPDFLHPTTKFATWALLIGGISSISLILGSIVGIIYTPKPAVTASLTAFGGGALLAALSVELIAPTVMEIVGQIPAAVKGGPHDKAHALYTMLSLLIGCIVGGLIFFMADEMINSKGGYFRKISTLILHFKSTKQGLIDSKIKEGEDLNDLAEVKKDHDAHGGGPMAIWLGLLIDGIPESLVIGAGFLTLLSAKLAMGVDPVLTDVLPYTLIAGLFLSNFPEALSSSVGMRKQGMSAGKILLLWGSMVVIISVGSMIGYYVGAEIPHEFEIGIEGIAAGAMLTMIAQTMIPEAVHIGGQKVVGLSTLIGYLSAVAFKLLE